MPAPSRCWYLALLVLALPAQPALRMPLSLTCTLQFHPLSAAQRLADGAVGAQAAGEALRSISREFHLKLRVLYPIMQSSKLGSRAPALRQLVSRLNFNGFADRQARPAFGGGVAMQPASSVKAAGGPAASALPPASPINAGGSAAAAMPPISPI